MVIVSIGSGLRSSLPGAQHTTDRKQFAVALGDQSEETAMGEWGAGEWIYLFAPAEPNSALMNWDPIKPLVS